MMHQVRLSMHPCDSGHQRSRVDYYKEVQLPLTEALSIGDAQIIERLLTGRHSDRVLPGITSFLHLAAANGSVLHCKMILEQQGDANAVAGGKTPLHVAAQYGNADVATLLLEEGHAVPNLQDEDGNTALHLAKNEDTAKELLNENHKTNLDIPNGRGQVPLHIAATTGDVAIANLLLLQGADQCLMDDQGQVDTSTASSLRLNST